MVSERPNPLCDSEAPLIWPLNVVEVDEVLYVVASYWYLSANE
jgi:hypothetical protein